MSTLVPANDSAKNMNAALTSYVASVAATHPVCSAAKGYTYGCDLGPKFARVWKSFSGSKSVVCFVDLATGEIHGAKSWKSAGRGTGSRIPVAA